MIITVTWDDINKGLQCNRLRCPLALALRRRFPQAGIVSVGPQFIRIDNTQFDLEQQSYRLNKFLRAFDNAKDLSTARRNAEALSFNLRKSRQF